MLKPRLIPSLLIRDKDLIKTVQFQKPKYIGDPLNAVRIFNEKEVDEITIFDIGATFENKEPNFKLIERLSQECQMPMCYGGGIKTISQIKQIISLGVEKISISSAALFNPELIQEAVDCVGSQSVVVTLDISKSRFFNKETIFTHNGKKAFPKDLFSFLNQIENHGAGEIIINNINKEGLMQGYDLELVKKISKRTNIPLTFLGGAGSLEDIRSIWNIDSTIGAAAGSIFVFKGKFNAVLINYPSRDEKKDLYFKS